MPESQKRPIVVAAWGKYVKQLRGSKKVSYVIRQLGNQEIPFTRGTLWQYERGTVGTPDPVVLLGLSEIYRTDIVSLISVLKANRLNPKLKEKGVQQVLQQVEASHETNAAAVDRLAELEGTVADLAGKLLDVSRPDLAAESAGQTPTTSEKKSGQTKNGRVAGR